MPANGRRPRYRGAIIGLGGVARQSHVPGFALAPAAERIEIVGAVDAAPGAVPIDGVPLVSHRRELARLGPIDFVDICTPTASHLGLTLWALEEGYHVLCEKPVALDRAEAARIRDAARAAGRVVMPCHQYRYNPAWAALRRELDAGTIGRWHLAEFQVYRMAADVGAARTPMPWRGHRAESCGGVLLDHGSHLIYSLLDLAGEPAAIRSWVGRLRHQEYDVEDTAQLLFEYPDRLATMFLTWAGARRETSMRFIGERGVLEWKEGVVTVDADDRRSTTDFSAQLQKASYAAWFARLFGAFADALDRHDVEPGLADLSAVAAVLEDAYTVAPAAGAA